MSPCGIHVVGSNAWRDQPADDSPTKCADADQRRRDGRGDGSSQRAEPGAEAEPSGDAGPVAPDHAFIRFGRVW